MVHYCPSEVIVRNILTAFARVSELVEGEFGVEWLVADSPLTVEVSGARLSSGTTAMPPVAGE
jgi:hypothetical protein